MIKKITIGIALLVLAHTLKAQNSLAHHSDSIPPSWNRFSLNFGGFFASYNSGVTFASQQLGLGFRIDIEDALGLETTQFALRGQANYRIGKTLKHLVSIGYFSIKRTAVKRIEKEIDFDGVTYPVGTKLSSSFTSSILRAKYDYAFFQDNRVSLGASFGFFVMPVTLKAKAPNSQEALTKFTAPLPLVGLRSGFKITKKFFLKQSIELLYVAFANIEGRLVDFNFSLEHKTFKHIGVGAGVNSMFLDFSIKNQGSVIGLFGNIEMSYTGLLLYGKYYF